MKALKIGLALVLSMVFVGFGLALAENSTDSGKQLRIEIREGKNSDAIKIAVPLDVVEMVLSQTKKTEQCHFGGKTCLDLVKIVEVLKKSREPIMEFQDQDSRIKIWID